MSDFSTEAFSSTRYLTLVIRLVVDSHGKLLHGELVEADGTTLKLFRDQEVLIEAVRACIADLAHENQHGHPNHG